MILKKCKPTTAGSRHRIIIDFSKIPILLQPLKNNKPLKKQLLKCKSSKGRNFRGRITTRHKGGGHKRLYRKIDFSRNILGVVGKVTEIEYDPNRTANIARITYTNGTKFYIIHSLGLKKGMNVISSPIASLTTGNHLPLRNIPLGAEIHNIELHPGKGGQLVRAAGTSALVYSKMESIVTLKLPSGQFRNVEDICWATIGRVSNKEHRFIKLGKAGRSRWLGKRPTVRGSAQNAVDHPHGGGEGKSSIGRVPSTPWGKPALGVKTRKSKKWSDQFLKKK